jgi:exopolysaccharide production protein ExoQ
MPSPVALLLTFALIFYLFRRDRPRKGEVSGALWIPLLWILITGSRFVSQWLALRGGGAITDPSEGSPIDAIYFLSLIVLGWVVLNRRGISLREFASNNRWITAFLLYCLVSLLWSEFAFFGLKRFLKVLGHPIMALLVLTEPNPKEAIRLLFRRCSYVLLPLSLCFIKYFPEYGRGYDEWTGMAYNQGVGLSKNSLGTLCMILAIFLFWDLLQTLKSKRTTRRRMDVLICVGFLGLTWYLLRLSSSATSLLCVLIGICTILALGWKALDRRRLGIYVSVTVIVLVLGEQFFGIYAAVVHGVGRNLTLTDRTDVWRAVLQLTTNPLLGTGFESFWLGPRLEKLWALFHWRPIQAHNGYLETYINLGLVGVVLLAGQLIGTFWKIKRDILQRFEIGRLRLAFFLVLLVHNYTEAGFVGIALTWTIFYLIAVDYPPKSSLNKTLSGTRMNDLKTAISVQSPPPDRPVMVREVFKSR